MATYTLISQDEEARYCPKCHSWQEKEQFVGVYKPVVQKCKTCRGKGDCAAKRFIKELMYKLHW